MSKIILIIFFLCLGLFSHSQNTLHYQFTHVSQNQGLSSIYVRKIVQDSYGYIWAGTQDGLNRYDGRKIIAYNKDNASGHILSGSDVRDLLIDSSRSILWVVTSYGGIDAINYLTGKVVFKYEQQKDPKNANILFNSIALVGDNIYIGSSQGLFRLDYFNQRVVKFDLFPLDQFENSFVDKLVAENDKFMWVFLQNQGILLLDFEHRKLKATLQGKEAMMSNCRVYDAAHLENGKILLATNEGLKVSRIDLKGNPSIDHEPFHTIPYASGNEIYTCCTEKNGSIWFSNASHVVRISPNGIKYELLEENTSFAAEKWLSTVYSLLIDHNNNIWLGCQQGLAHAENRPSGFFRIYQSVNSSTKIGHAYYLFPSDSNQLICCAQDGLYDVNPTSGKILAIQTGIPFYHAFKDPFNKLLVSNLNGTFVLSGTKMIPWQKTYVEFAPFAKLVLNSHVQIGDSVLLMGTENFKGLLIWNFKKKSVTLIDTSENKLKLGENVINGLYKDLEGRVWVLGDRSISIIERDLNSIKTFTPFDRSENKYFSIFFDACQIGNSYFIASYGNGVLVLNNSFQLVNKFTANKNLSSNSVYKLIPYHDTVLFVTSNNGLSMVSLINNMPLRFYFEADGLHSNTFEENSGVFYDETIYAGGEKGLSVIIPKFLTNNKIVPNIYWDQISIQRKSGFEDTFNLELPSITIPNDVLQISLSVSAPEYTRQALIRYSYKISEVHNQWISINSQDVIPLLGLAPGKYHLAVRASLMHDIGNSSSRQLVLIFRPKWYQTFIFKAAIVLLVFGILYAFYRFRISQEKQRQKIRRDIAGDLHDDIGSTLTAAKVYAHLAKKDSTGNGYIEQLEESLTEVTFSLRDIIWVLDDSNDSLYQLAERVKKFAIPLAEAKEIAIDFTVNDEQNKPVSKTEKRNLLLMIKEAINNSVRHSDCTSIRVKIERFKNNSVKIVVSDNGKGFNTEANPEGHGLKNIQFRARQISYTVFFRSSSAGTKIEISN
jgi:ligand-binding sensor domain-containing protein